MGHRRPRTCKLDMLPAPGETSWPAAVVERERRVAGEVLERNGHMVLDCRKSASMVVDCGRANDSMLFLSAARRSWAGKWRWRVDEDDARQVTDRNQTKTPE